MLLEKHLTSFSDQYHLNREWSWGRNIFKNTSQVSFLVTKV